MKRETRKHVPLVALSIASALSVCVEHAHAQCSDWSAGFRHAGLDGSVRALTVFDDGSGPAVFAGGDFTAWDAVAIDHVAKWNGTEWSPLGAGVDGRVHALAIFDDGSGPALFAAGGFTSAGGSSANHIAKWDGASWSPLGSGIGSGFSTVYALCVFDDGSGPALFAGGDFLQAGGSSVARVAKWNGASWSALNAGVDNDVYALTTFDDGSGTALFVGGKFTHADGGVASRIAKWDGVSWSVLGSGVSDIVYALSTFDDGGGTDLYVGGAFLNASAVIANHIARWNGSTWSALASGFNGSAELHVLYAFDDGAGTALYAAGKASSAGGTPVNSIAKWNGTSWSALGLGVSATVASIPSVLALVGFSDGPSPRLVAGGVFEGNADVYAPNFATWDGAGWSAAPSASVGVDASGGVFCATAAGPEFGSPLFIGGDFTAAGPTRCNRVARWDGEHWSALGAGTNGRVRALATFDDGSGPALFVGGEFTSAGGVAAGYVAKWDGALWSTIDGFDGAVFALAVVDLGGGAQLYAAGNFTASSGTLVRRVARWNGTGWSALGYALSGPAYTLRAYDDGNGPALYVGGGFTQANQMPAPFVAKWDGSTWSALPQGPSSTVYALTVFDGGSGPQLVAGGEFLQAGGTNVARIASWNGAQWSALGTGVNQFVRALASFNDGRATRLFVGGEFTNAGGMSAKGIASWDGASWSALDGGLTNSSGFPGVAYALTEWQEAGTGISDLYVGGGFAQTGDVDATNIGRFGACRPGATYCFGDDLDPFATTDCPCGNFGASGHGCANSNASLGGARMTAVGTTNPNTVVFTCTGMPNNSLATFWRGTQNIVAGQVFHDGIQCAAGTVIRFGQQAVGLGGNPPFTAISGAAALAPGVTRYYQVLYRNPNAGFCPPGLFNFSNGYKITW